MVLAGAAMAQQPEQQASPEKQEKKSQAAEAKPETQKTAPAKEKKTSPAPEQAKPKAKPETGKAETGTDVRGKTDVNKTKAGTSTSQTTKVNKQEFKSRHSEVFSLGRHPKEFFIQRFGENHFRLIGQTYFVFVDGCWVAVDVEGFVFVERIICEGDPDFIAVVD